VLISPVFGGMTDGVLLGGGERAGGVLMGVAELAQIAAAGDMLGLNFCTAKQHAYDDMKRD